VKAKLSYDLRKRIVGFLVSLPAMSDWHAWSAFIVSVGLDGELENQVLVSADGKRSFFEALLNSADAYGRCADGRYPIVSILQGAKERIGRDRRSVCDLIIADVCKEYEAPIPEVRKVVEPVVGVASSEETSFVRGTNEILIEYRPGERDAREVAKAVYDGLILLGVEVVHCESSEKIFVRGR